MWTLSQAYRLKLSSGNDQVDSLGDIKSLRRKEAKELEVANWLRLWQDIISSL